MRISDWSSDVCSSDLVQPGRYAFDPAQDEVLDGIEADGAKIDGLFDRRLEIGEGERFQQAQYLHIFAPAMFVHAPFHHPLQCRERFGQVPALQRRSLVECVDLLLDPRAIMERVEDNLLAGIATRMTVGAFAAEDGRASCMSRFVQTW